MKKIKLLEKSMFSLLLPLMPITSHNNTTIIIFVKTYDKIILNGKECEAIDIIMTPFRINNEGEICREACELIRFVVQKIKDETI